MPWPSRRAADQASNPFDHATDATPRSPLAASMRSIGRGPIGATPGGAVRSGVGAEDVGDSARSSAIRSATARLARCS